MRDVKSAVLKMLKEPKETTGKEVKETGNTVSGQNEGIERVIITGPRHVLEQESSVAEANAVSEGVSSWCEQAEERTSLLKVRTVEVVQCEEQ